jgi:hypothetical protein
VILIFVLVSSFSASVSRAADNAAQVEVKNVSLEGGLREGKARLVIEADLSGFSESREKVIYGIAVQHAIRVSRDRLGHVFRLDADAIQGGLREITLTLSGEGEVREVTGDGLEDWSVRQAVGGSRYLVLRLKRREKGVARFSGRITAETELKDLPTSVNPLTLTSAQPALANGYVRIDADTELEVQVTNPSGVVPVELKFLPEGLGAVEAKGSFEPLAFRFHGTAYRLPLSVSVADPEARGVVLVDSRLIGRFAGESAAFTLTGTARVKNPKGGSLELLSGGVALTDFVPSADWRLEFADGRFIAVFGQAGEFPVQVQFNAAVCLTNDWEEIDFTVAPGLLQPVVLQGLKADTQFRFIGAARPERSGEDFVSYLPPSGRVKVAWKEAKPEAEGKLFFAAEALWQIAVSPGLMRQTVLLDFKVMQGEVTRVGLRLDGEGEVTRVQGQSVLSWNVESAAEGGRHLVVQMNAPQKDQFSLQVQMQTPLGAFPQTADAFQLWPEGATRYGGHVRIVNEGAVRLEVLDARGFSQISPEQFPDSDKTRALLPGQTTQAFAYRFSGGGFKLRIRADNILPELAVSVLLAYHLGETELAIESEIELDVREAPLRELLLRVPQGYAIARVNGSGLSDYFLTESGDQADAQLRIIYASPVTGRQVVQLRLERNKPLGGAVWSLPRIDVVKARSVRGHVGVSADAGFRLIPATIQGLTEVATAFFPRKMAGIQAAFRLSDAVWQATLSVERLPQSIQADALHLFSVGEGIAYGSSIVNYLISGAPVSAFRLELSDEYFNVEFTGRDVRNWQRQPGGYQVQLHTPVSGTYTLLATYERPFKAQGEKLTFTGARPIDAQSEQGHTIVISTYQFNVQPVNVSGALRLLEPGEVPAEYRLFFDAPILAAYRYTARPFNLELELKPLAQGQMVNQVIDRAALTTRISEEGQVVTDARYFVKNKGTPHLRLVLPPETQLWSVTVNGAVVVPVADQRANLILLPQRADPNSVNDVQVKLASRAKNSRRLRVDAPIVAAPVLLAEWRIEPDRERRLVYRRGTLTPVGGVVDVSGFAGLARMFQQERWDRMRTGFLTAVALVGLGTLVARLACGPGAHKFSPRHVVGGALGLIGYGLAAVVWLRIVAEAGELRASEPTRLMFVAPVQPAESALSVEVGNLPAKMSLAGWAGTLWPALLAAGVWAYGLVTTLEWFRKLSSALGWTALFWAVLRVPNGAPAFLVAVMVFIVVQLVIPGALRWWRMPRKQSLPAAGVPASAIVLLLGAVIMQPSAGLAQAPPAGGMRAALAESVTQQVLVEDEFVFGAAKIRWVALKGQQLSVLYEPGVLTRLESPTGVARLVQVREGGRRVHRLIAERSGPVEVECRYQVRVGGGGGERGFTLPTQHGLVNRVTLTVAGLDVDVVSPNAVSVQRAEAGVFTNTVAELVLAPVSDVWIGWKPRARDTRREKAVFYAETSHLYVPEAGVVEGLHQVHLRPAQGALNEVTFGVPVGSTITDVVAPMVSLWRFDPDTRRLRVSLSRAQDKPFALVIKSQIATGPLPVERPVGVITVEYAASQVGLLGVATGSEVQLDEVKAEYFSAINLEDFPTAMLELLRSQIAGLTLRRAYRYSDPSGSVMLKVSAVEPDVRVEAQQTLSLAEDRTVLAATLNVEIMRAGIFKLSFLLPDGLELESATGAALSHWTDLRTEAGRLITLNLKGKTEGQQQFGLSLAGPGVRPGLGWQVPRLVLREAEKQRGQLLIVPEQGMRLQVATREGVTQLDPVKSGVQQKGVLAFRLLQSQWLLTLDLERVDAWVQVTSLQHVTLTEGQLKVAANLQYEIENTGVKALHVRLPAGAENVRFRGEQLSDFLSPEAKPGEGTREWEIKLHRRVLGRYLLQLSYTQPLAEQATETTIEGVQCRDVNLQRGFLTIQTGGRMQARVGVLPEALQPTEWQVIPRALQQDMPAAGAEYTFRLVESGFRLPIRLERHEAARLLPARVNSLTLTSVISDNGVMLTQARLEMIPGDKRLLHLTLPDKAQFWFAFVNQNSVWPWREANQVLLPLEQQSKSGEAAAVEFFYTSQAGAGDSRSLDLELVGPKFDLPLENIKWHIYLSEKWRMTRWSGPLQLEDERLAGQPVAVDLQTYIQNEARLQQEKTREAEELLSKANTLLERGDPQQARRAFQAAYGLSQHDSAFNEDARVQLHNLKMQQALVGLNVRQARVAGETGAVTATPRALREGEIPAYTQEEAKRLIERNTAEDNAVQMRLAERVIQQQDAAVAKPAALRASIPEQGRRLTFTRPLEVNTWADLKVRLEATARKPVTVGLKFGVLAITFLVAVVLGWLTRGSVKPGATAPV